MRLRRAPWALPSSACAAATGASAACSPPSAFTATPPISSQTSVPGSAVAGIATCCSCSATRELFTGGRCAMQCWRQSGTFPPAMNFTDLDEGRALCGRLMEVFVEHTGGRDTPQALECVEKLCDAAVAAIEDLECRVAMRGVKSYSRLLFSGDPHLSVDAGGLAAVDYLRFHIRNCLSMFRERLGIIEAERLRQQQAELETRRHRQMEPAALSAELRPERSGARGIRVLVVEDNRDAAESLRQLLYYYGYEVAVAYTGQEGLRAAKRMRPDVVLCDIGLPDSNGFVVAAALREDPQTCEARLIAVTAYGQDEDRRRAREAGFDLHLVKPVDPVVLLRRLQS